MPNYAVEMQRIIEDMRETETALLATNFSSEQWKVIKTYILSALSLNAYAAAHIEEGLKNGASADLT